MNTIKVKVVDARQLEVGWRYDLHLEPKGGLIVIAINRGENEITLASAEEFDS